MELLLNLIVWIRVFSWDQCCFNMRLIKAVMEIWSPEPLGTDTWRWSGPGLGPQFASVGVSSPGWDQRPGKATEFPARVEGPQRPGSQ